MDDPGDDPRPRGFGLAISDDSGTARQGGDEGGRPVGGIANILELMSTMFGPSSDQPRNSGGSGGGVGMRIIINGPGGARTLQLGGPNTLGQRGTSQGEGGVPRLSEYASPRGFYIFLVILMPLKLHCLENWRSSKYGRRSNEAH